MENPFKKLDEMNDAEGEVEDERPLCSVLTTVINHYMVPPSPLEPEEFQAAKDNKSVPIQVPVMRIFGPIIRGDAPSGTDPVQSACLYVHGAFPYMLARPVLAGPDGSLHHSSHMMVAGRRGVPSLTSSGHVDWDNLRAVEGIASVIQETLEAALQATSSAFGGDDNNNKKKKVEEKQAKFIRGITVVMGRGFYTYCPGPAAPFLRVEYYDPRIRWKVKMVLERGLDLPSRYHPDAQQYDAVGQTPAADSSQVGLENLSFHCYEAHIPYTMQFFKDWNLAGMAYVHLDNGKFRGDLPSYVVQRWQGQGKSNTTSTSDSPTSDDEEEGVDEADLAFLASNTAPHWVWEKEKLASQSDPSGTLETQLSDEGSLLTPGSNQWSSAASVEDKPPTQETASKKNEAKKRAPFWSKKETTCDVEIDAHVSNILNIKSVMKEMPEDTDEGRKIHWRAVPSLREIWHEERRRMKRLLEPQDDFLSGQSAKEEKEEPPPFTLSVKKDASIPGAMQAAKGMKRLLNVSHGLEQGFMRAAKQIVQRHSDAISRVDKMLHETPTGRKGLFDFSDSTPGTSSHDAPQLTPTVDDALDALGQLASQFNDKEEPELRGADFLDVIGSDDEDNNTTQNLQGEDTPQCRSQNYDTLRRAVEEDSPMDQFELSQRIERGDSLLDGQHVEDYVDPETLAPFDFPGDDDDDGEEEDEDNLDEKGMELILTHLGTQLVPPDDHQEVILPPHNIEAASGVEEVLDGAKGESFKEHKDSDSCSSSSSIVKASDEVSSDESALEMTMATAEPTTNAKPAKVEVGGDTSKPPSRGSINKSQSGFYRRGVENRAVACSWLQHSHAYEEFRTRAKLKNHWAAGLSTSGYIQPTRQPPRRDEVKYWHHKQAKRGILNGEATSRKKSKISESGNAKDFASATHEVDSNTGKIVPAAKKGAVQASDTTGSTDEVEEVRWVASQSQAFSVTQDEELEVNEESNQEVGQAKPPLTSASAMNSQSIRRVAADLSTQAPNTCLNDPGADQQALQGMQNQGGRLVVEGGGQLKAKTRPSQAGTTKGKTNHDDDRYLPSPLTMMSIEVHVQCRTGRASGSSAHEMAMTPVPETDKIYAIAYAYGRDPGGGAELEILERGCLFVPLEHDSGSSIDDCMKASIPRTILGVSSPLIVQSVPDETKLLLRLAGVVRQKDPDMLLSWDSQGAGLGYIVERGANMGNPGQDGRLMKLEMDRLLGRLPMANASNKEKGRRRGNEDGGGFFEGGQSEIGKEKEPKEWSGSGLGGEWDDRVGAGRAAASIAGRLVFAGWKIIAEEVKHPNYSSLNAMVSSVLSKRIPFHDDLILTNFYAYPNGHGRDRWRVLHHRLVQCTATLQLFDALDIIGRAGEAARLSGVEFSQSFPGVRGSQYKVEGVLLRALQSLNSEERGCKRGERKERGAGTFTSFSEETKTQAEAGKSQADSPWKTRRKAESAGAEEGRKDKFGYFFFSPSLKDTEKQEALEVQALTLEPQSGHQTDPVVVCDFTALYPSLMIAYNLCYSTCSGRLSYHTTRPEMLREGKTTGRLGPFRYPENRTATILQHHMKSLGDNSDEAVDKMSSKDRVYIAGTGTMFVSESVVRGVLPQVLDEMLSTRAMLKKASKEYKKRVKGLSPSILRQLEARQLALKYVANVTYGYTSATFSGRCAMPLLADTIVDCGRRTLTNAINLANSWGREPGGKWHGCEVLYGDTDSCFIKLPGRSIDEAFDFGEEFCRSVTAMNPPPVQLKLEKVYLGSILQTKKKYCGMKFESRNAKAPEFEAKGIETIRRDQCALTQKVLKNSLVMLFRHGIEAVRDYLCRQWSLILAGRLPVSDFILTGRVRSKYRGGRIGPVQAALFRRLSEADPGRVMRNKERISYVIVATPGASYKLRDCVLTPIELLAQWDSYTLHSTYYIVKHVNAALERCLGLAPHFIKINDWYERCPKPRRRIHFWPVTRTGSSAMISAYFGSDICSLCGAKCLAQGRSRAVVCTDCRQDELKVCLLASKKLQKAQEEAKAAAKVCSDCNHCFEDASTFAPEKVETIDGKSRTRQHGIAVPIAACTCIDCPNTYKRHRLREECLEMEEICKALDLWRGNQTG